MNGSTKGGKESAARSANLGGCKGRAANEDRRQTKRTRMGCGANGRRENQMPVTIRRKQQTIHINH